MNHLVIMACSYSAQFVSLALSLPAHRVMCTVVDLHFRRFVALIASLDVAVVLAWLTTCGLGVGGRHDAGLGQAGLARPSCDEFPGRRGSSVCDPVLPED